MKLYYGYKITNLINNRFYYGVRKCRSHHDIFGDNYFGSGKILRQALKKNELENFRKEFIYIFCEEKAAYDWEGELVTQDFIDSNPLCYNIKPGGSGGQGRLSEETKRKIRENHPHISGEKHHMFGKHHSVESKKKNSIAHVGIVFSEEHRRKLGELHKGKPKSEEHKQKMRQRIGPNKGKKFSEETRAKMSISAKKRCALLAREQ